MTPQARGGYKYLGRVQVAYICAGFAALGLERMVRPHFLDRSADTPMADERLTP